MKLHTLVKPQDLENHTLFSGTHPYRPDKGVPPPLGTHPHDNQFLQFVLDLHYPVQMSDNFTKNYYVQNHFKVCTCTLFSFSLRAVYGTDSTKNALHGSDSYSSAEREIHFFFPDSKYHDITNTACNNEC